MSFSKARIQRFNEISSEAPPPGAYDPKFEFKIKGLVIEKTDRFTGSESNLSISTKSTGSQGPTFRTPQLPRKRMTIKPLSTSSASTKVKPRILIGDKEWRYDSEHELSDLQVECANKDKTIQEQERHIEDMKDEIRCLDRQLEELREKQAIIEVQHKNDLEKLNAEMSTGREEHQVEGERLRSELSKLSAERDREIEARKEIESNLRAQIQELSDRIIVLEAELAERNRVNETEILNLETRVGEILVEMQTLNETRKTELELWQKEAECLNSCIGDLRDNRDQLEEKLEQRQSFILKLQAQLSALQCELDELKAEYENVVEDTASDMADLQNKHKEEIDKWRENLEKEKETVRNLNQCLQDAEEELEEADKKHNVALWKHKQEIESLQKLHEEEKSKLTQYLEDARQTYSQEIENLTLARDREVAEIKEASAKQIEEETRRIQEHTTKIVENAEAVTRETLAACRAESEERVKRVIAESDAKVNAMIRDARAAVEEDMRLTAERYKACLARVEAERATLDEKLAQRDAEITKLSMTLEELKASAETQESFSQSLQMELDRAETELAEKKLELRALKDQIRSEAAEMVARRRRFEVIMAENQASVAALTKRLAQSTAEVERLQSELKRGEECIHEHRDLLSIMRSNSKIVHEQVQALMEQLDAKKTMVVQLEADSMSEFETIKAVFEAKIDNLKQVTANEITRLQEECDKKSKQNAEMKNQLDEMAKSLTRTDKVLLDLESRNDAQEVMISRMEVLNKKLEEELKTEKAKTDERNEELNRQKEQDAMALDQANASIKVLTEKLRSLEETEQAREDDTSQLEEEREAWRELEQSLLQQLQEEKVRREKAEMNAKNLDDHNKRLLKDYADISEQYAEILGHQNQRQRIKHVTQLKTKINQLELKEQSMLKTIEHQQKIIEKLKVDDKRVHIKGKENALPVRSIHTTPASSPHKPLTPLRNRNE